MTYQNEEERIFAGVMFSPADPELKAIKQRSHRLSALYSATTEDQTDERARLLHEMLGAFGEGSFIQGPVFFHYGVHTFIGAHVFINYDFTVQDDARVTIGDNVNFGPRVTVVTPSHPMLPEERLLMLDSNGKPSRLCWAKPVNIGSNVWICANVTVCGGVTIGEGSVIGAGSVVVKDIPPRCFAAGNPCRVIRFLTEADSMKNRTELLGGSAVLN